METGNFKKLFRQLFLLSLPIVCIVVSFFVFDPYGFFLPLEQKSTALIPVSDDYIAVERYLQNTPQQHYNSFTFGNSKTLAFLTSDWCNYIPNCRPFKFGVPGECIFNINNKLKLIDAHGDSIKHVLILLDNKLFLNFKNTQKFFQGPAYIHHPYSMDGTWMEFYSAYLKYYFADFAFMKVAKYKLSGSYTKDMESIFKNPTAENKLNELTYLPLSNEVINTAAEALLTKDSTAYFNENKSKFANRNSAQTENTNWKIKDEDLEFLEEIQLLFKKHHTKYTFILGPNYDQIPFPITEKIKLQQLFGAENIYDFTGVNSITNAVSNYYEQSHYRITVGKQLLQKIYAEHLTN